MKYSRLPVQLPRNLSHWIKREPGWILPNLLLTYACTQDCMQCSIPQRASKEMTLSTENLELITRKLKKFGTQGLSISGGDPLAHPYLLEYLDFLVSQKFAFLHLLTNLHAPDEKISLLAEYIVRNGIHLTTSFDGFGEIADKIRGGDGVSDKVIKGIYKVHEANQKSRKKIQTRATVVISQLNLDQVPEILNFFEKIHWEVTIDIYRFSSVNHIDSDELHIRDMVKLEQVLNHAAESPVVVTPRFLIKGFIPYLLGEYPKRCPYLDSPTLGSKFFIQPNGDVLVCKGGSVGNLLKQTPAEIIKSETWAKKMAEFHNCEGCWNPCYTTFSGATPLVEMITRLKKVTKVRKS
ncbi:MAG: radical SAM protein [Bacteroidetes bacterium]|jgi:MoaA/NifB/PqqE/SkfB family radical SAM enzyme|nr:radical SAM protein [Bacteroidota bacterium]MBT3748195.1 radical SAM protein [Bacteroidota bacterium]MBT4400340.1 radical SAM protein [Bacteroidota bacterium]MBT5427372.1 radical SAM protein [Bacteroidota bacterium]MBT7093422.1 radical SAM protein [Bacteroidota bacterium]